MSDLAESSDHIVAIVGHQQFGAPETITDQIVTVSRQLVDVLTGLGGNIQGFRHEAPGVGNLVGRGGIDFVENGDAWSIVRAELLEDIECRLHVILDRGGRDIEDLDDEIRDHGLLESRFECLDQTVGQATHKPYCIGQQEFLIAR
jgi:hypothetical protein